MSTTTAAPWTFELDCDTASASAEKIAAARTAARVTLWGSTGRRLGLNTTVGELFRVQACDTTGMPVPYLRRIDREWSQAVCSGHCTRVTLRNAPVREVTEVRISGVVSTGWSVAGGVVTLPESCPVCDQCAEPDIEIDYTWGVWPPGIEAALSELACEYLSGLTGGVCRLSARAVSIARQGVQIEMENASELLASGLTGLPLTDAFIRALNPNQLQQRSRVLSVDRPSAVG